MKRKEFRQFLSEQNLANSTIRYTDAWAVEAEGILGVSLDSLVLDDEEVYRALLLLKPYDMFFGMTTSNAVRKYYEFIRGKKFPKLKDYEK